MTAQDQQSRELLPCPFCGQQDAFVEQLDTDASVVICDARISEHCACLARGPVAVRDDEDEMQPGRTAAIAAWNRRAPAVQAARALPAGMEPIGVAKLTPGTNSGFTSAVFREDEVPPGTNLYAAARAAPENVREGEPYDNPAFEDLARTMGVWGTAQAALCAQFFIAGRGALPAGMEPVYQVSQPFPADPANTWRDASEDAYDLHMPDRRRILYTAAQVLAMGRVPMNASFLARCTEILRWQKTGLLTGEALRTYAAKNYPDDVYALKMAEVDTALEAFRALTEAAPATTGPQAPTTGAGSATAGATQERKPLTDEKVQDLIGFGDPTEQECHLVRLGWDAAQSIEAPR